MIMGSKTLKYDRQTNRQTNQLTYPSPNGRTDRVIGNKFNKSSDLIMGVKLEKMTDIPTDRPKRKKMIYQNHYFFVFRRLLNRIKQVVVRTKQKNCSSILILKEQCKFLNLPSPALIPDYDT